MYTALTEGIKVSVEVFYQHQFSIPTKSQYVFAYRVTIVNESLHIVQLTHRHWYIFESTGIKREVKGPGVVGEQPILKPDQQHQYVSGSHMATDIGAMYGTFQMVRQQDQYSFNVQIPRFDMVAPFKLN